ncbi:hypothetical protein, partial [Streptomyces cucumeris]|uniref:hypothetical protein n=1 Tax=Streptomyces cucumeris TaxID=2962890 RepID=UPI0020C902B0
MITPEGAKPRSNRGPETEFGPETERKTDLVRLETRKTEGKSPEEPVKRFQRKRPFLENSTACQKSTPDMLIPRPHHHDVVEVPLKKHTQRGR